VTAQQATKGQATTLGGAVSLDGLLRIGAAAWPEAAVASEQGREEQSIRFNEKQDQTRAESHCGRRGVEPGL
jgi:hypothetical protein